MEEKQIIKHFLIKDIYNIDIKIPSIQRLEYQSKIKEIIEYQENYFKKHKRFNFLGVININYCIENKTNYLIDGQHRYQCIRKLNNLGYGNEKIYIEINRVDTINNVKENYELINKNTPLPEFCSDIPIALINDTLKLFREKYQKYFDEIFSEKTKCHRPKISRIRFEECLEYISKKLNIISPIILFNIIEKENNNLSKWKIENYPKMNNLGNPQKILNTCREYNFYLGLFLFNSEEYIFDWVKNIIKNESGEEIIAKRKTRKKKNIPKVLKDQVWDKYIGETIGKAKCLCCKNNNITQKNFDAGHIIAESKNGKNAIENLRPICKQCNLSMGNKNMYDFIKEYYS